jgi:hypothetical protein
MATGTKSNFQIFNEYTHTGMVETLVQVSEVFNAASQGSIRLTSVNRRGDFNYESFFASTSGLVTRRITKGTGSTSAVTDLALSQSQKVGVKINRKIGPVANTLDSFKKIGDGPFDENALNYAIGVQAAKAMQVEMCDTALAAAVAALKNQSAVKYTVTSNGTLATSSLVSGLAKFGDQANRIVCWVMHSKPFYDLVQSQIAANIDGVSNFVVAQASPITLNRPVLVTDSPSLLLTSGSPAVTDYFTLGLTVDALECEDSEESTVLSDIQLGLENLVVRMQGEYAYNMSMKGFTWDVTNGGENPTVSALGTGSNWDPIAASYKDYAGIVIQSR